jgi:hypothetical protein
MLNPVDFQRKFEMWVNRQFKRVCSFLFILAMGSVTLTCESQVVKSVTAKDVCSFVTKEMTSALPQVPTLCVPKSENGVNFELSVFSPTDVLEGKMRRTWSTALFIVFNELYFEDNLHRTCKGSQPSWFGCIFLVSDSYLSQHGGKQYRVMNPEVIASNPGDPIHGDPSSDEWYKRWWFHLILGTQWGRSGTQENAKTIALDACVKYIAALRRDPFATLDPKNMPIPDCSVLLVTSSRADVIVNFPDSWTPSLVNYVRLLAETFGKTFDGTPYVGAVIFRSPWESTQGGETMRSNWSYDLNDLEFDWEEFDSGVRPDAVIEPMRQGNPGQTELHSLSEGAAGGIVLKVVDAPGRGRIMDLTNGTEWLISSDAESKATFAGGW